MADYQQWTAWRTHAGTPLAILSVIASDETEAAAKVTEQLTLHRRYNSPRNDMYRDWVAQGRITLPKGIRPDLVVELPINEEVE